MALLEQIDSSVIKIPLSSKNKDDVLVELVNILKDAGKLKDVEPALKAIIAREELSSTGLGGGIAVPHAKISEVSELTVALGLAPQGIDFDAIDGIDSTVFFLILAAPDQTGPHLQALGEIAQVSRDADFIEKILQASSAKEVADLFFNIS